MSPDMMVNRRKSTCASVLCCVLLLAASPWPAGAASHDDGEISRDAAVTLVRDLTGGTVLRAETKQRGERKVYEILVKTDDWRLRTYVVDATTGEIE
jgi:uncharacterized membrane protein YkoI